MKYFGSYGYIVILFLIILCVLWMLLKKKKVQDTTKLNSTIKYVSIPMAIYLVFSIICSPYIDLRYLMPVIPLIFCSLIYVFYDIIQDIISKKKTFLVLLIISICFAISVIPKLSNNSYTYKGHRETLDYLENVSNIPMVYVYEDYSAEYNKTMECYEALTKMDKTYIMSTEKFSLNNVEQILKGVECDDEILLMMHSVYRNKVIDELLKGNTFIDAKYVGRLGRFVIYELK